MSKQPKLNEFIYSQVDKLIYSPTMQEVELLEFDINDKVIKFRLKAEIETLSFKIKI